MSGLTRDGAVNPSRETKISGANGGRKTNKLPVQMTTGMIGSHTICSIYTLNNVLTKIYIHTHIQHSLISHWRGVT